jgi:hypothetical protein
LQVQVGDNISKIDDQSVHGMSEVQVMLLLEGGLEGTEVKIDFLRKIQPRSHGEAPSQIVYDEWSPFTAIVHRCSNETQDIQVIKMMHARTGCAVRSKSVLLILIRPGRLHSSKKCSNFVEMATKLLKWKKRSCWESANPPSPLGDLNPSFSTSCEKNSEQ